MTWQVARAPADGHMSMPAGCLAAKSILPKKGVIRPHQRRRHLFKQLAGRPRDQRPLGSLVSSRSTCRSPSRLPQLLPSLPPPVRRRHVHLHRKASIPYHYGSFQQGVLITSGCRLHELSVFGTPCGTFIPLNQGCQQSFGHGTGTQGAASTTEAQSAWQSLAGTNDLGPLVSISEATAFAGEASGETFVNDFHKQKMDSRPLPAKSKLPVSLANVLAFKCRVSQNFEPV